MGAGNSLFCAGKREIPCAGTGIYWQKNNRTWEWDYDFIKTATRTNCALGHWDLGWEMRKETTLPPLPIQDMY